MNETELTIMLCPSCGAKNDEEMNVMGMSSYDADNGSVSITVGNAMGFFTITVETIQ